MFITIVTYIILYSLLINFLNIIFGSRDPKNFIDFCKLYFLPYLLYCLIFNKNKLK